MAIKRPDCRRIQNGLLPVSDIGHAMTRTAIVTMAAIAVVISILVIARIQTSASLSNSGSMSESEAENSSDAVGNDSESTSKVGESDINRPEQIVLPVSGSTQFFSDVEEDDIDAVAVSRMLEKRRISAYRVVQVDSDAIRAQLRQGEIQNGIDFRLLDDIPVTFVPRQAADHTDGWKTGLGMARGQIRGDPESYAQFVIGADGAMNGVFRSVEFGRIKIERIPDTPHHMIWKLGPGLDMKID